MKFRIYLVGSDGKNVASFGYDEMPQIGHVGVVYHKGKYYTYGHLTGETVDGDEAGVVFELTTCLDLDFSSKE